MNLGLNISDFKVERSVIGTYAVMPLNCERAFDSEIVSCTSVSTFALSWAPHLPL